jgi:2,4-dienoyl-CoA reductase-like NADH-dependent reductase (Old Yellow Enzyme family)
MIDRLSQPLDLPCGASLANRLAKAVLSEGIADDGNHSTPRLEPLYSRWSASGAGLLITGNYSVLKLWPSLQSRLPEAFTTTKENSHGYL